MYCIGPLLIALTIGACQPVLDYPVNQSHLTYLLTMLSAAFGGRALFGGVPYCLHSCRQPEFLFSVSAFVTACVSLSLVVNFIATGLIAYKAWCVAQSLEKRRSRTMTNIA